MRSDKNIMFNMGKVVIAVLFSAVFTSCAFAGQPASIVESNINNGSFTISWLTTTSETGYINYGESGEALSNTAYDKRGQGFSGRLHYVTVRNLDPDTSYDYNICSGAGTYGPYTVSTGSVLSPMPESDLAYGHVFLGYGSTPAEGAVVYFNLRGDDGIGTSGYSQNCSSLVDNQGIWLYQLVDVRDEALNGYFEYSKAGGDTLIIEVKRPYGEQDSFSIDTQDISNTTPAPDIILAPTLPVFSDIEPTSGSITTDGKVSFKATIQDNISLKAFRMLCYDHFSEAITGDIYINLVNKGEYTLTGNGGYVDFPTQGLTSMQFEFRPKTAFYANPAIYSYTRHTYWIGVYDIGGNWTSQVTSFYIRQLSGGGGPPGGGCFLAETPILMADGSTKPIEDIKVGDKILAFDETTNAFKPDKVKRCFVFPEESGYLVINNHIKVTPKHRFMIKGNPSTWFDFAHHKSLGTPFGRWREAGSLKLGDKLYTSKDKLEPITSIERIEAKVIVYNLEVNPYHTFIADGVVVHNMFLKDNTSMK